MNRRGGRSRRWQRGMNRSPNKRENATHEAGPSNSRIDRRDRPPPGLRGKEIGLWHRDRARARKGCSEKKADTIPQFQVPCDILKEIESSLEVLEQKPSWQNINSNEIFPKKCFYGTNKTFEEALESASNGAIQESQELNNVLKIKLVEKMEKSRWYKNMNLFREKLPCFKMKEDIVKFVAENQVVVLSGETGCGKTTQVCQFILDDYILSDKGSLCKIVCTQPRRISAISVAERVAQERDEQLGESIGYQIRLEKKLPLRDAGTICYVTTGILLQWMQSDPTLSGFSHIFIDEVHERDVLCDFLITFVKEILTKRPDLRVILMSATLNAERFSLYFGGAPFLHIPGFTFPVTEHYIEDILPRCPDAISAINGLKTHVRNDINNTIFYEYIAPYVRNLEKEKKISAGSLSRPSSEEFNIKLIVALISYICNNMEEGAILTFVPGIMEITNVIKEMKEIEQFRTNNYLIIPLHSTLSTIDQKRIFNRPPKGVRKIIIATNIAETSITVDDVVYVIDSGYAKISDFDIDSNVPTLTSRWITCANARQRRGRAGRVGPGHCFKLYTRAREQIFDIHPLPEIQRTRLESLILQAKILNLGNVGPFLKKFMDPPDERTVEISLEILRRINALNNEEKLTSLGYHLAKLTTDPQIGKMLLMGAIFSCLDPILTIAAALSFKEPFVAAIEEDRELERVKAKFSKNYQSDHLTIWEAFVQWEKLYYKSPAAADNFAHKNYMSSKTLQFLWDLKKDFAKQLYEMKFVRSVNPKNKSSNVNSCNIKLLRTIICAGLYPNIAKMNLCGARKTFETSTNTNVQLHIRSNLNKCYDMTSPFLAYNTIIKSSSIFIHDATVAPPLALILFGENLKMFKGNECGGLEVDSLVKLSCLKSVASMCLSVRKLLDVVLNNAMDNPESLNWEEPDSIELDVLQIIVRLMTNT